MLGGRVTYRRFDPTLQIAVAEAGIAMRQMRNSDADLYPVSARPYGVSCRWRTAIQRQRKVSWRARGVARQRTMDNQCFVYPKVANVARVDKVKFWVFHPGGFNFCDEVECTAE